MGKLEGIAHQLHFLFLLNVLEILVRNGDQGYLLVVKLDFFSVSSLLNKTFNLKSTLLKVDNNFPHPLTDEDVVSAFH